MDPEKVSLEDWLNDQGTSSPDQGPAPNMWGVYDFYEMALANGIQDKETVTATLVLVDRLERMYREQRAEYGSRLTYDECVRLMDIATAAAITWEEGYAANRDVMNAVWHWRATVFKWRVQHTLAMIRTRLARLIGFAG
jgi:hypothetical protein